MHSAAVTHVTMSLCPILSISRHVGDSYQRFDDSFTDVVGRRAERGLLDMIVCHIAIPYTSVYRMVHGIAREQSMGEKAKGKISMHLPRT